VLRDWRAAEGRIQRKGVAGKGIEVEVYGHGGYGLWKLAEEERFLENGF